MSTYMNWIYCLNIHDDVIKWKHFPRYWPFVRGIHQSPVNSPHKGQWRGALMFSSICAWINVWIKQSWGCWFETTLCPLWRHRNGYDIFAISVSWLHDCVLDFEIEIRGYNIYRSDRLNSRGGCVCVYVKYCYDFSVCPELMFENVGKERQ